MEEEAEVEIEAVEVTEVEEDLVVSEVEGVPLKSLSSLTDYPVSSSPEEPRNLWSPRTWCPDNQSITKNVSALRSTDRKSSTEFGTLIVPRLLPQSSGVSPKPVFSPGVKSCTWELLQELLFRTCLTSLDPLELFTQLSSLTELVEILSIWQKKEPISSPSFTTPENLKITASW